MYVTCMHALHDGSTACAHFTFLFTVCLLMWCFIYTLQIIAVYLVVIIEQWFVFYCISIVSGSPWPCWSTLYTSNKCPPGISPHSLPSFVVILSLVMLAVVNCNLPVSDLNSSHAQFIWYRLKACDNFFIFLFTVFLMWCFIFTLQVPSFL